MNILFRLQGFTYEWDAAKAKSNILKHDVTFEEAADSNPEKRKLMKNREDQVKDAGEEFGLTLRKRESKSVALSIPIDVLDSLAKIATSRDLSLEALLKFYIGQGLRQDLAKRHAERVMETTAAVLKRHQYSKEEVSMILSEIQIEATL